MNYLGNPYSDIRSEVMTLAGELRGEGLDASEALEQAWAEVKGETNPPKREESTVEPSGLTWLLLLAGAGLISYRLIAKKWPWAGTRPIRRVVPTRPLFPTNSSQEQHAIIVP